MASVRSQNTAASRQHTIVIGTSTSIVLVHCTSSSTVLRTVLVAFSTSSAEKLKTLKAQKLLKLGLVVVLVLGLH